MKLLSFFLTFFVVITADCSGDTGPTSTDTGDALESNIEIVETERKVDLVDPFIGTDGQGWWVGSVFVGAQMPFGMVQLGPDGWSEDYALSWLHCSGYHATDDTIMAFSHMHLHGTGIPDGGAVGVMAVAGAMDVRFLGKGHWSRFDKADEVAGPGYYAVILADADIRAELTATVRTGVHRYTPGFEEGTFTVLIDNGHAMQIGKTLSGSVEIDADTSGRTAHGQIVHLDEFSKAFGGVPVFWAAEFSRTPVKWGTFNKDSLFADATLEGAKSGAFFEFDAADGPVELKLGLSFVDDANARANLDHEAVAGFDSARSAAADAWEDAMSPVTFEGGSPEDRVKMATALYHSFMMPNLFMDFDGRYLGYDDQIHQATGFDYYTNFSLWDTYRNLHSLLILLQPERQLDMVRSLVQIADDGGYIPRWGLFNGYTNCMIGTSADPVIAETYIKGLTDFDVEQAYENMRFLAMQAPPDEHPFDGRNGISDYITLGYVAADRWGESVSRTLEFAIDDFGLANLAGILGKADDAALFAKRAGNYENLWHDDFGFFLPRLANGTFIEDIDPLEMLLLGDKHYTEGNAMQYCWLVPQDPDGLMALMGGQSAMLAHLQEFFDKGKEHFETIDFSKEDSLSWMTEAPPYYWHGNEPDIHAVYLFGNLGRRDLLSKWIWWIRDTLYTTQARGIPGNDDAGTLAGWYVFSAMGFYPVAGSDLYWLGHPLFDRMTVALGEKTLVIEAPENGRDRTVKEVTLNGKTLAGPYITHDQIMAGGTLTFAME